VANAEAKASDPEAHLAAVVTARVDAEHLAGGDAKSRHEPMSISVQRRGHAAGVRLPAILVRPSP
jgi:hypothetical protein